MGKNNYLSTGFLNLIFNGTTLASLFENASSSPITQLWISLHTADPGASGNQTTSEIAYTGYARVAVNRNTGGWPAATAAIISPAATISFPTGTGGTGTAAFMGIGTAASGAGNLLYSGPITPNISCGASIQPQLTTATTISES
jgi:hypothetical protein